MKFEMGRTYRFDKYKYIEDNCPKDYKDNYDWIVYVEGVEFTISEENDVGDNYSFKVHEMGHSYCVDAAWCVVVSKGC